MKFNMEIEINKSRAKVIELFDNPDNMKYWQPGLISYEPISGETGKKGAKSRLKYIMGKREIEMVETITVRNLPDEFSGTYEAKGVWNEVKNFFREAGPDKTLWITENEFVLSGFMKVFGAIMPGSFKKETFKIMKAFKDFAENGK